MNCSGGEEVLKSEGSDLHDVADVEGVYPLILVEVAEDVFHVSIADLETHAAAQSRIRFRLARFGDIYWREHSGLRADRALQAVMPLRQGSRAGNTTLSLGRVILQGNLLQHVLEDWEQLDSRFLQQGEAEIGNQADLFQGLLLDQLLREVAAEAFSVVDQEVGNHDSLIGVQGGLLVLVDLRVQRTDLHVCLALVFQHFQLE